MPMYELFQQTNQHINIKRKKIKGIVKEREIINKNKKEERKKERRRRNIRHTCGHIFDQTGHHRTTQQTLLGTLLISFQSIMTSTRWPCALYYKNYYSKKRRMK